MHGNSVSHARLMRQSTDRVELALHSDNYGDQLVAKRILESSHTWQHWESEHSGLMHTVAANRIARAQALALKRAALRLIHRKALFEYLRNQAVRGEARAKIIRHFHPTYSYSHAIVVEHGIYLRKACSFLCTTHVGGGLFNDAEFLDPMKRYEMLYAEYFDLYARTHFMQSSEGASPQSLLLPLLKLELQECREAITDPKRYLKRFNREAELRQSTDTQIINTQEMLKLHAKPGIRRPAAA